MLASQQTAWLLTLVCTLMSTDYSWSPITNLLTEEHVANTNALTRHVTKITNPLTEEHVANTNALSRHVTKARPTMTCIRLTCLFTFIYTVQTNSLISSGFSLKLFRLLRVYCIMYLTSSSLIFNAGWLILVIEFGAKLNFKVYSAEGLPQWTNNCLMLTEVLYLHVYCVYYKVLSID